MAIVTSAPQPQFGSRSQVVGSAAQTWQFDYLANGVQLGFLLDPTAETATVYRPGQVPEELAGFGRELSGEAVLPGFRLDLRPLGR